MRAVITCAIALTGLIAVATPARAQGCDIEGQLYLCGFVWNDADTNGVQDDDTDPTEMTDTSALHDVNVTLYVKVLEDPMDPMGPFHWDPVGSTTTVDGIYSFGGLEEGSTYKIVVGAPTGMEPTITTGGDETTDSDGVNDAGGAAVEFTFDTPAIHDLDFGFHATEGVSPGTGTPGYWKNHPEAWPYSSITIGGVTYSVAEAISYMGKVSKDKRISLFTALVAAKLNVAIGNESSCIAATISEADAWMAAHPLVPGGVAVAASSEAWQEIAVAHNNLDDYNNGRLCAPHRN